MRLDPLKQLARAIPLVAVAAFADEARADNISCPGDPYYDPCTSVYGWVDLAVASSGTIPVDGVLLLQGAVQGQMPGVDAVELTVSSDGVPLAGQLEAPGVVGTLVWRPSTPWTPGATYQISGKATNPNPDSFCLPAELPLSGEVTIAEEAWPPPAPLTASGVVTPRIVPQVGLDTLACCVGASPTYLQSNCGGTGGGLQFDPQQCTPISGRGYFDVKLTGAPVPDGPLAEQLVYELGPEAFAGQFSATPNFDLAYLEEPVCLRIDVRDLGAGTSVPGVENCFGEMLVDQLGPVAIDPAATLDCEIQTCELNADNDGWSDQCTPWDPAGGSESDTSGQSGEKGCGCATAPSPAPGLLALVGALALARRRRR